MSSGFFLLFYFLLFYSAFLQSRFVKHLPGGRQGARAQLWARHKALLWACIPVGRTGNKHWMNTQHVRWHSLLRRSYQEHWAGDALSNRVGGEGVTEQVRFEPTLHRQLLGPIIISWLVDVPFLGLFPTSDNTTLFRHRFLPVFWPASLFHTWNDGRERYLITAFPSSSGALNGALQSVFLMAKLQSRKSAKIFLT